MDLSRMAAASKIRQWRAEPPVFVRDVFGITPDAWQDEILEGFPKHNRIAGLACKGPGKTALMAWLGWNFLATRPDCKVPCTSITGDNLKDCLWAEFKKWQNKAELLSKAFTWTQTRLFQNDRPETWWASARTWAKDDDPQQQANTLAGLHEDFLLFLIDEVTDIPDGVVSAAEAALTGGTETKLVIMGNATRTEGPMWRAFTADRHLWLLVRVTGDPDNPKRSPRIDIDEARRQIEKYGRDSYIVRVNILGEFPLRQADKLIDIRDCEEAMARSIEQTLFEGEARVIGVDVARFGDDASIFFPRQGRMAFRPREFRGLDTVELGEQLIEAVERWDADAAFVDAGGMGVGVIDHARHRGYGNRIHAVNFGGRAADDERFENKRAEMYWRAAQWTRDGGCLPNDAMVAAELSAPVYWYDKRSRICLEPKDDIKPKLGRSPDKADGFVLTFSSPVRPRPRPFSLPWGSALRTNVTPDYDPYARAS